MKEIERKFLIKDISNINLSLYRKRTIVQSYLYSDLFSFIRKRIIEENLKKTYYYTVKTGKNGKYGINEFEKEITEEEYNKLSPLKNINVIIKDRYYIPLSDNLIIELDVFKGIFEGIIFAEVEFKDENQALNFKIPNWFDKELTGKVSNSMMSTISRKELDDIINKIL